MCTLDMSILKRTNDSDVASASSENIKLSTREIGSMTFYQARVG